MKNDPLKGHRFNRLTNTCACGLEARELADATPPKLKKIAACPIHRGWIKLADEDDMEFELGDRLMITQNGRPMLDISRDGAIQLRSLIGAALAHRP